MFQLFLVQLVRLDSSFDWFLLSTIGFSIFSILTPLLLFKLIPPIIWPFFAWPLLLWLLYILVIALVFLITLRPIVISFGTWQRSKERKRNHSISNKDISKGVIRVGGKIWDKNEVVEKDKGWKVFPSISWDLGADRISRV